MTAGELEAAAAEDDDPLAVTLDAIQRSQSTLEHVSAVYLGLIGLDPQDPRELFRHLPARPRLRRVAHCVLQALWFVEAHIYHLDELNEKG